MACLGARVSDRIGLVLQTIDDHLIARWQGCQYLFASASLSVSASVSASVSVHVFVGELYGPADGLRKVAL